MLSGFVAALSPAAAAQFRVGMTSEPTYCTGEPIRESDVVRHGKWDGVVESVITSDSPGWAGYWQGKGEGVMLAGPAFGRLYTKFRDEDLVFVRRKQA